MAIGHVNAESHNYYPALGKLQQRANSKFSL